MQAGDTKTRWERTDGILGAASGLSTINGHRWNTVTDVT